MIDWNNNGKIDGEDLFLTDVLLDDEKGGGGSSGKPNGNCLASFLLFLSVPVFAVLFIGHIVC